MGLRLSRATPGESDPARQSHIWNRQSALLQEVKAVLAETYPGTDMRGDGQVVVVRFESYNVEVVPAFLLKNGQYWICDTNEGAVLIRKPIRGLKPPTSTQSISDSGPVLA